MHEPDGRLNRSVAGRSAVVGSAVFVPYWHRRFGLKYNSFLRNLAISEAIPNRAAAGRNTRSGVARQKDCALGYGRRLNGALQLVLCGPKTGPLWQAFNLQPLRERENQRLAERQCRRKDLAEQIADRETSSTTSIFRPLLGNFSAKGWGLLKRRPRPRPEQSSCC